MPHTAVTTMGLKSSPHSLSVAGQWAQLMHQPGAAKYIVVIVLAAAVAYLFVSIPRAILARRR